MSTINTGNESFLSRTRPVVNNVKTALEVPPIDGEDYINPVYSRRLQEGSIDPGDQTPVSNYHNNNSNMTQAIGTGLPENVPGHDSILLTKSRTDNFTPQKKNIENTTMTSTFARSRNMNLTGKSKTEVLKGVSFSTNK